MLTLAASALAGGDCIHDADALRAGGTEQVLGCAVEAPSTLGTFLLSFRWGHVRQLDRVSRELLARAWAASRGQTALPDRAPNPRRRTAGEGPCRPSSPYKCRSHLGISLVASRDIIRSTNGRLNLGRNDLARNSAPVIAGRAAGHRIVLSPDGSSDHLPNQLFAALRTIWELPTLRTLRRLYHVTQRRIP